MNVVVVGAGIVGYAVAYELAARGARVQLVDPRGHGRGATRASAGILAPYIEGHLEPLLQLGIAGLDHYDRFVARLARDANVAVEYRRVGTLQAALTSQQAAELEEHARRLRDRGVVHSLVTGPESRTLEPGLSWAVTAGLVIPQHGYVGVASVMAALAAAASDRHVGVRAARVISVSGGSPATVALESGETLDGDAVVLAAGSWSGAIGPVVNEASVRPIRGQLIELHARPGTLSHVVWGSDCYLVPWVDGTVLAGATMEDVGFDERTTPEGVERLRRAAVELAPALASAVFVEARAGLRPATPDELPIIGPSSRMPGVYYATGHFRNGVLLAPLTAVVLSDLMVDGRSNAEILALVRPDRFGL